MDFKLKICLLLAVFVTVSGANGGPGDRGFKKEGQCLKIKLIMKELFQIRAECVFLYKNNGKKQVPIHKIFSRLNQLTYISILCSLSAIFQRF